MALPKYDAALEHALSTIIGIAGRLKNQVQQLRDQSAAGNITQTQAVNLQALLNNALAQWTALESTPGLVQYAKDQYNNQQLNIVTEYNATKAAATSLRDWLAANIPAVPTYTPAQTAGFRTEADAFTATVE